MTRATRVARATQLWPQRRKQQASLARLATTFPATQTASPPGSWRARWSNAPAAALAHPTAPTGDQGHHLYKDCRFNFKDSAGTAWPPDPTYAGPC